MSARHPVAGGRQAPFLPALPQQGRQGQRLPGRAVLGAALALAMHGAPTAAPAASPPAGAEALAVGKRLFMQGAPACATCHTLRHAGAEGAIGPNLDELGPDTARVEKAVRNGIGVMPPFAGKFSDEEIRQLASYVAAASRLP